MIMACKNTNNAKLKCQRDDMEIICNVGNEKIKTTLKNLKSMRDKSQSYSLLSFKFPNGEIELLTMQEASMIDIPEIQERVKEIRLNKANKRMIKDGFEPGWQANINAYAGDRSSYNRLLKEHGLVEVGYDHTPIDTTTTENYFANDEMIKACLSNGIELSGNEISALKDGSYFKDVAEV